MYVSMYVSCLRMQFTRRAGYPVCADCGPFVVHLTYYSGMDNEDDEERSRRLATLDTRGRLPTSDLADETMDPCSPWDCGHYAVYLRLRGRSRQLTRLPNFFELGFQLLPLHHIPFFKRCCATKKRHVAWWTGPQMYDFMVMSAHAWGLLCVFIPLVQSEFYPHDLDWIQIMCIAMGYKYLNPHQARCVNALLIRSV